MPIFTSRFSPERSLVGNFVTTRTRENEDAESREKTRRSRNATSRSSQAADRLDIANREQSTSTSSRVRNAEQTANLRTETTAVGDTQVNRQLTLRRASQEAEVVRSNLRSSTEETTPTNGASAVSATQQTTSTQSSAQSLFSQTNIRAVQSALTSRIEALVNRLSELRSDQSVQANRAENVTAAQSATPASVEEAQSETPATVLETVREDENSTQPGARLEARIEALREVQSGLTSIAPPEPPAREEQEASLRADLQTIASGLQSDAAIENQITAEETRRNSEVVVEREQRQTIRENQVEIRDLQTSRRQLDQEAQRTDQAIRQLQSETNRLKNGANASGTALNILAQ